MAWFLWHGFCEPREFANTLSPVPIYGSEDEERVHTYYCTPTTNHSRLCLERKKWCLNNYNATNCSEIRNEAQDGTWLFLFFVLLWKWRWIGSRFTEACDSFQTVSSSRCGVARLVVAAGITTSSKVVVDVVVAVVSASKLTRLEPVPRIKTNTGCNPSKI